MPLGCGRDKLYINLSSYLSSRLVRISLRFSSESREPTNYELSFENSSGMSLRQKLINALMLLYCFLSATISYDSPYCRDEIGT